EDTHSLTFGVGDWLLWRARNKRLFEQVTETCKEVAHRCDYWVALITSSWKTGQLGREVRSLTRQTQLIGWRPSDVVLLLARMGHFAPLPRLLLSEESSVRILVILLRPSLLIWGAAPSLVLR
ncbi:hypothetical protein LINGRAHAP2_LOCUS11429, partial [Linum grandiflorum]